MKADLLKRLVRIEKHLGVNSLKFILCPKVGKVSCSACEFLECEHHGREHDGCVILDYLDAMA